MDRRGFLMGLAGSTALFTTRGLFAQTLRETASMTEGPFYPDKLPLDTDNDLLIINDSITPAVGEITRLSGRILSASGEPVANTFVEIWQVDAKASYLHANGRGAQGPDVNFQGYGRFLTDAQGQYYFRTIKPVPYTLRGSFRAPHIHFALSKNGRRIFTTQVHVRGHEANEKDNLLRGLNAATRETVLTDFKPVPDSRIGELAATWDIVLGRTAADLDQEPVRGGIGRMETNSRGRGGRGR
ncbi:MAG TPA: protocatechuate 3,4-dioxygenase [Terriglobia bacterium]|nr:protocatechuate 3,4-dioxygenase [Terriglobia bacterium]